ncbi:helix-turn-helix domain-containing protein [Staphylococcus pettenkoferi]|nr:hypothetical protein CD126_11715 [Staphylococcus pettenkoferi]QQC36468.1 helix-turn-helix domain-containing protein [Staphylococcus pettenkoferi]
MRVIVKHLNRSVSTVSREIKRNVTEGRLSKSNSRRI